MPYRTWNEIEKDIQIEENKSFNDVNLFEETEHKEEKSSLNIANISEQIKHVVDQVAETDTLVTLPWIFHLLKKNKEIYPFDIAYSNWLELRKLYGKNDEEKNLSATHFVKSYNKQSIDEAEKNDRQIKMRNYIKNTADAIQNIQITMQNLKDVFLLIALIKGLHERFHSLDQESLLTNSKACVMTKIIAFQTGKNREENFHPIYNAIEKLVNKHTLLRNAIPTSMVVKKAVQMKRVRFADETKTRSEISDEKRGCKPSLKKPSFELNNELINAKNYFLDKLLEYEKKRKNLIKLKKIKNDIDTALQEGRVIPFNARSLIYTDLTEDEKNAWYYYSYNQEYYYYHFFVNLLKRFIGNYQSAEEIMQPLYRIIAREKEQFKTDFEIMNAAREKYMQLHEEVEKRNLELKTAKLALKMQRKSLREKRKIIEEKKEIEVIVTKPPLTTKFSWWRHYISPFLKILTGAALGAGIGFGVGFLIGTLCGGLGVLISAPFLAVMGGLIGLIVSSHYACKNIDEEPRIPEECAECKESIVNIPTQNIHRNLKIKPQLQNNPEQKIEDIKLATHISPTHITPTATTHLGVIPTGRRW